MKIKLLVSRTGVAGSQNRGDEIDVEDAEALRMIAADQAVAVLSADEAARLAAEETARLAEIEAAAQAEAERIAAEQAAAMNAPERQAPVETAVAATKAEKAVR